MAGQPNLDTFVLKDWERRLRKLETASPLNNAAIGRGGLRVYDGGVINIENGGLVVNGSATIIGTLNADGTINMTGVFVATGDVSLNGPTDVTGDFTVTGPTKLNGETDIGGDTTVTGDLNVEGPLDVTGATKLDGKTDIGGDTTVDGTLDIKGKSTLQNDLTVQGGGKIKVGGSMTLNPSKNGGSVEFNNGTEISSTGSELTLKASNASVSLGTSTAILTGGSSNMVMAGSITNVTTPLFMIDRRFIASGLPAAPAGAKPNLYRDPSTGELKQIP